MSKQFSTEHIDKTIENLKRIPAQSIADDLKAYFIQMLRNADFVQVVRCKNCKYYKSYCDKYKSFCAYHITEYDKHNGECSYIGKRTGVFNEVNETDFCSYAEWSESDE